VAPRFNWEPPGRTLIEVHPNHERFAVRITGMPHVHTLAACTGPVIAMEVPREGPPSKHLGIFDWPRVLQHEYTHTITLGQTQNRIPHWLTEAAAVSMEPGPRDYDECRLLAHACATNTLFNLDEIKWAFVRPKKPTDRGQAYAQGHWMVEYMNERFGESALVRLLERYFQGEREQQAIPAALGISRDEFFRDFLVWADKQVESWGLAPKPSLQDLKDELRSSDPELAAAMKKFREAWLAVIAEGLSDEIGLPSSGGVGGGGPDDEDESITADDWPELIRPPVEITDEVLARWIAEYPDHPDLLEEKIRRQLDLIEVKEEEREFMALLERYAALRPVDPLPHKKLAQAYLAGSAPHKAIAHLEFLDIREEKTPAYAIQLAKLYRDTGDLEKSLTKAVRAVHINPYSAPNRELAATIAMQAGQPAVARQHIAALTLIEPDRPQHKRRLEAIDKLIKGDAANGPR
jgi:tetratricopeptide (TPR) repeat protein